MLFAVFSDSHGNKDNLKRIISYCKSNYEIDRFIYLGDGLQDIYDLIGENVLSYDNTIMVRGNCDLFSTEEEELLIEFEDVKILVCHGHRYGVKHTLEQVTKHAHQLGAKIVLYGHTHIQNIEQSEGIYAINPGASSVQPGFIILEVEKGKFYAVPIQ